MEPITGRALILAASAIGAGLSMIAGIGPGIVKGLKESADNPKHRVTLSERCSWVQP
jgi:F0F1-type ATP synthase membrane subunit c/vacuolar-type H+-ATPase subunit K